MAQLRAAGSTRRRPVRIVPAWPPLIRLPAQGSLPGPAALPGELPDPRPQ